MDISPAPKAAGTAEVLGCRTSGRPRTKPREFWRNEKGDVPKLLDYPQPEIRKQRPGAGLSSAVACGKSGPSSPPSLRRAAEFTPRQTQRDKQSCALVAIEADTVRERPRLASPLSSYGISAQQEQHAQQAYRNSPPRAQKADEGAPPGKASAAQTSAAAKRLPSARSSPRTTNTAKPPPAILLAAAPPDNGAPGSTVPSRAKPSKEKKAKHRPYRSAAAAEPGSKVPWPAEAVLASAAGVAAAAATAAAARSAGTGTLPKAAGIGVAPEAADPARTSKRRPRGDPVLSDVIMVLDRVPDVARPAGGEADPGPGTDGTQGQPTGRRARRATVRSALQQISSGVRVVVAAKAVGGVREPGPGAGASSERPVEGGGPSAESAVAGASAGVRTGKLVKAQLARETQALGAAPQGDVGVAKLREGSRHAQGTTAPELQQAGGQVGGDAPPRPPASKKGSKGRVLGECAAGSGVLQEQPQQVPADTQPVAEKRKLNACEKEASRPKKRARRGGSQARKLEMQLMGATGAGGRPEAEAGVSAEQAAEAAAAAWRDRAAQGGAAGADRPLQPEGGGWGSAAEAAAAALGKKSGGAKSARGKRASAFAADVHVYPTAQPPADLTQQAPLQAVTAGAVHRDVTEPAPGARGRTKMASAPAAPAAELSVVQPPVELEQQERLQTGAADVARDSSAQLAKGPCERGKKKASKSKVDGQAAAQSSNGKAPQAPCHAGAAGLAEDGAATVPEPAAPRDNQFAPYLRQTEQPRAASLDAPLEAKGGSAAAPAPNKPSSQRRNVVSKDNAPQPEPSAQLQAPQQVAVLQGQPQTSPSPAARPEKSMPARAQQPSTKGDGRSRKKRRRHTAAPAAADGSAEAYLAPAAPGPSAAAWQGETGAPGAFADANVQPSCGGDDSPAADGAQKENVGPAGGANGRARTGAGRGWQRTARVLSEEQEAAPEKQQPGQRPSAASLAAVDGAGDSARQNRSEDGPADTAIRDQRDAQPTPAKATLLGAAACGVLAPTSCGFGGEAVRTVAADYAEEWRAGGLHGDDRGIARSPPVHARGPGAGGLNAAAPIRRELSPTESVAQSNTPVAPAGARPVHPAAAWRAARAPDLSVEPEAFGAAEHVGAAAWGQAEMLAMADHAARLRSPPSFRSDGGIGPGQGQDQRGDGPWPAADLRKRGDACTGTGAVAGLRSPAAGDGRRGADGAPQRRAMRIPPPPRFDAGLSNRLPDAQTADERTHARHADPADGCGSFFIRRTSSHGPGSSSPGGFPAPAAGRQRGTGQAFGPPSATNTDTQAARLSDHVVGVACPYRPEAATGLHNAMAWPRMGHMPGWPGSGREDGSEADAQQPQEEQRHNFGNFADRGACPVPGGEQQQQPAAPTEAPPQRRNDEAVATASEDGGESPGPRTGFRVVRGPAGGSRAREANAEDRMDAENGWEMAASGRRVSEQQQLPLVPDPARLPPYREQDPDNGAAIYRGDAAAFAHGAAIARPGPRFFPAARGAEDPAAWEGPDGTPPTPQADSRRVSDRYGVERPQQPPQAPYDSSCARGHGLNGVADGERQGSAPPPVPANPRYRPVSGDAQQDPRSVRSPHGFQQEPLWQAPAAAAGAAEDFQPRGPEQKVRGPGAVRDDTHDQGDAMDVDNGSPGQRPPSGRFLRPSAAPSPPLQPHQPPLAEPPPPPLRRQLEGQRLGEEEDQQQQQRHQNELQAHQAYTQHGGATHDLAQQPAAVQHPEVDLPDVRSRRPASTGRYDPGRLLHAQPPTDWRSGSDSWAHRAGGAAVHAGPERCSPDFQLRDTPREPPLQQQRRPLGTAPELGREGLPGRSAAAAWADVGQGAAPEKGQQQLHQQQEQQRPSASQGPTASQASCGLEPTALQPQNHQQLQQQAQPQRPRQPQFVVPTLRSSRLGQTTAGGHTVLYATQDPKPLPGGPAASCPSFSASDVRAASQLISRAKSLRMESQKRERSRTQKISDSEEGGWTIEQIQALQTAYYKVDPRRANFWCEVAKYVHGRTAAECFHRVYGSMQEQETRKLAGKFLRRHPTSEGPVGDADLARGPTLAAARKRMQKESEREQLERLRQLGIPGDEDEEDGVVEGDGAECQRAAGAGRRKQGGGSARNRLPLDAMLQDPQAFFESYDELKRQQLASKFITSFLHKQGGWAKLQKAIKASGQQQQRPRGGAAAAAAATTASSAPAAAAAPDAAGPSRPGPSAKPARAAAPRHHDDQVFHAIRLMLAREQAKQQRREWQEDDMAEGLEEEDGYDELEEELEANDEDEIVARYLLENGYVGPDGRPMQA